MASIERWLGRHTAAVYSYQLAATAALLGYSFALAGASESAFFTPQAYYLYPGPHSARPVAALVSVIGLLNAIPLGVGTRWQIPLIWRAWLLIAQLVASPIASVAVVIIGLLAFGGTVRSGAAPLLSTGYLAFGIGYAVLTLTRPFVDPHLLRFYRRLGRLHEVEVEAFSMDRPPVAGGVKRGDE